MKKQLWPICTREKRVPWIWVGFVSLPWASFVFFEQISNVAITFKLREFVSTPIIITLIGSLNLVFNIFVGATCNYASDRVWTPLGRRKPFLIVGWGAVALGCLILPEIRTLWLFVAVLFLYEMVRDAATPYESLCNEIVPPHQRGRANASFTFVRNGMIAFFFAVMVGRWDETYALPWGGDVSGQQLIFWTGALIALASIAFLLFGIREEPPERRPEAWPPMNAATVLKSVRDFLRNVFGDRQWRALYAVAVAQMIFWIDFGSLAPLLYTEQWGFPKQSYGNLLAISTVVTMVVFLPLSGWLADRMDRVRLFKVMAIAMTLNHLLLFLFIKLVAPDGIPSFAAVLAFKLAGTGIGTVGVVCSVSLMFDYVPRDRLGTVLSGVGITRGIANIFVNNGVGAWVTFLAWALPRDRAANGDVRYDYSSGYLYLVACGVAATWIAFWFARQTRAGYLVKLGVLEAEAENARA